MKSENQPDFSRFRVILKKTGYPENIGASARAMLNMGFSDLALVAPRNFDIERIKKTATHEAAIIVDKISIFSSIEEAVSDCGFVAGTTARSGRRRANMCSPAEAAGKMLEAAGKNKTAILFGPEDRGLENADLTFCDILVNIPTRGFSSVNLAQSVMITCYELCRQENVFSEKQVPKLAEKRELESMYNKLDNLMDKAGYKNPENPEWAATRFRQFFSRTGLLSREVALVKSFADRLLNLIDTKTGPPKK